MTTAAPRVAVRDAPRGAAAGASVEAFLRALGGPTVLRVAGRDRSRARGVATLLHGNEPSGVRALHAWLASDAVPAVDLVCFVGAVATARRAPGFAFRMLPGRRDLNRCFAPPFDRDEEGAVAGEALRLLREAGCDALLDLHNNTGHSPAYGVACTADAACINLTALFGDRLVASDLVLGTLTEATAHDFPSVAIECGRAGDPAADATALAGLARYAALDAIETRHVLAPRVRVLERPVRVCAQPGTTLAFGEGPMPGASLTLVGDIDRHNFELLLPGVPVGWLGAGASWPLEARGADGTDVSRDFFELRDGLVVTRRAAMPIMMTTDPAVAKSDCLFYLVRPRDSLAS